MMQVGIRSYVACVYDRCIHLWNSPVFDCVDKSPEPAKRVQAGAGVSGEDAQPFGGRGPSDGFNGGWGIFDGGAGRLDPRHRKCSAGQAPAEVSPRSTCGRSMV
jgi:hypothetical protein